MKRGISIAMVVFGLAAALTGIWQFFPPFRTTFYPPHAISACIFGLLVAVHIWLNRKPLIRYFKRLRWWWIPVGLGFAIAIWVGIMMPILLF